MRVTDFTFILPDKLIARYPCAERSQCRLLSLDGLTGEIGEGIFTDLLDKLSPGDLLVLNNTRVIPARLYGRKITGGKVEVLVERIHGKQQVLAHIRASKAPQTDTQLLLGSQYNVPVTVLGRQGELFELLFTETEDVIALLEEMGHIPLPPYLGRQDEERDRTDYQTVYAERPGAVAAPTAGLHFDQPMLQALRDKGVELAWVTLHVGAGTFQSVRVEEVEKHTMHREYAEVSPAVVDAVQACKARGNRVVAVGTTTVRCLESAAQRAKNTSLLVPFSGETDIFIYPGYVFRVVDALITNFHLPESTLLMLICAFAGHQETLQAYRYAVEKEYRFFSYGDAMFIKPAFVHGDT